MPDWPTRSAEEPGSGAMMGGDAKAGGPGPAGHAENKVPISDLKLSSFRAKNILFSLFYHDSHLFT